MGDVIIDCFRGFRDRVHGAGYYGAEIREGGQGRYGFVVLLFIVGAGMIDYFCRCGSDDDSSVILTSLVILLALSVLWFITLRSRSVSMLRCCVCNNCVYDGVVLCEWMPVGNK